MFYKTLDLEWLALKKFRDAKCSEAHIAEANWNLKMRHARCFILKKPVRTTREGLTGLRNVHIAESSFLVGAWLLPQHDASTVPVLQVQLVPPAPIIDELCFRHQPDLETTFKPFLDKQASSTWSTLGTDYLKDGHRTPAFSGHEGAAGMCSSLTKPLLFVVQKRFGLHRKRQLTYNQQQVRSSVSRVSRRRRAWSDPRNVLRRLQFRAPSSSTKPARPSAAPVNSPTCTKSWPAMDNTEFDKLIEQGKTLGFVGKDLYNFVEKERNRLKEERDAERIRYRQHLEFLIEQERENSRLRIQREKERLGLCATQSGPSLAAGTPSSVTYRGLNKQSYQDHVHLLRQKIESGRRMFETWDARHKKGKEPVGAKPLRAGQNSSTDEANIGFTSESKELAAESPIVATKATEGRSDGDEALCLESLVNTEMPSVIDLAQPPCMCVAMAANCDVRSTSGPAGEDPCTDSGTESCADAHCK
ncbi:hypothetical protein HPB51_024796 [Rhipicephalus microplus]|uniref:Uncharacterized protein n=1 Tax=Rhipicephalus microplus TaxID=6941 RepID=A0A9J6DDQ7_RHIMP|nr:hypothetical protein HPB51_024796 [Rhipicephalus microplus]